MAKPDLYTDPYGNPNLYGQEDFWEDPNKPKSFDPEQVQRSAQQSSGGYQPPKSVASQWNNPKLRDEIVRGWTNSSFAPTNQGIRDYLTSLGGRAEGWRVDDRDKVYDPSGRVYDWIGDFNTAQAQRRSGYTTDKRFADITGSSKGNASAATKSVVTGPAAPVASAASAQAPRDPLMQELLNTLIARSKQGLQIDRNDPLIRTQADPHLANLERARRNYLADVAEQAGPLANLRGEERMAAERFGSMQAEFESELVGRELTARRNEIVQALEQWGSLLTAEEQRELQLRLAQMDDAIKRMQIQQQGSQFADDLSYRNRALTEQGRQYDLGLGFKYDEFDWLRSPLNPSNYPRE